MRWRLQQLRGEGGIAEPSWPPQGALTLRSAPPPRHRVSHSLCPEAPGSPLCNPPQLGGRVLTTFLCTVISYLKWQETIASFSAFLAGWLLDPAESLSDNQGSPSSPTAPGALGKSRGILPPSCSLQIKTVKWSELLFFPSQSSSTLGGLTCARPLQGPGKLLMTPSTTY